MIVTIELFGTPTIEELNFINQLGSEEPVKIEFLGRNYIVQSKEVETSPFAIEATKLVLVHTPDFTED